LTIGTGSKSLTIQTGKSIVVGMTVKIAYTTSPTNWMVGDVTAYNSSTGVLDVNVTHTNGSGTQAAWTVSLSGVPGTNAASVSVSGSTITDNFTITGSTKTYFPVVTTAIGKSLTAPDATTLEEGLMYVIDNRDGGYPVGFRDSTGVLVGACVAAGGIAEVWLKDNSTAAGSWEVSGNNLEPGLITIDNTFSSTYSATVHKPFVALDDNKSIHFLTIASNGFAAVAVDKTTGAVGTPLTITTTASSVPKAAFRVTATTAVVFFGESNNVLRAAVITLSGATTLAVGTSLDSTGTNRAVEDWSGPPKIAQLDSTHYLVSAASATGAGVTEVFAMEITAGTTINWGSAVNIIAANNVVNSTTTYALTATTGLVLFAEGTNQPRAVVVSVSGTTCTVGAKASSPIAGGNAAGPALSCLLSSTKCLIVQSNNSDHPNAVVFTISGTSVTAGAQLLIESIDPGAPYWTYTLQSATRHNPHLWRIDNNTAGLWYLDSSNVSRALVLSESGGTVTAGTKLHNSISAAAANNVKGGLPLPQGTGSFLSVRKANVSASGHAGSISLVPHKISGTTITAGPAKIAAALGTPTSSAFVVAALLSSGDYCIMPPGYGGEMMVVRTNGDAINIKGSLPIPIADADPAYPVQAVSSNRIVFLLKTTDSTINANSTFQLRLLSVEIAQ
jgi:hypothetical protein